jgi:hypothetical protein
MKCIIYISYLIEINIYFYDFKILIIVISIDMITFMLSYLTKNIIYSIR